MAKQSKRRNGKKLTIPVAVVAGLIPVAAGVWDRRGQPLSEIGNYLSAGFTGWSPNQQQWHYQYLKMGLLPVGIGVITHMLANKLGINRAIARTGIPLIRI